MKPSVGRVVWFWPLYLATFRMDGNHVTVLDETQGLRADVDCVNKDGTINVSGADHEGYPYRALNVPLFEPEEDKPADVSYCTWMPYQVGQAKKHETAVDDIRPRVEALEATMQALMTPAASPPPPPPVEATSRSISASDTLAAKLRETSVEGSPKSTP